MLQPRDSDLIIPALTSYDSWLHGSKAPPANGGQGAKLVPGESFSIAYGGKSDAQEGNGVSTTVSIGELSVSNYVVGTVTHDVYKSRLDGILGLAFTPLNSCMHLSRDIRIPCR